MSRKTWGSFAPAWTGRKRGMRPAEWARCARGHITPVGTTKRPRCHECARTDRVKQSAGPQMVVFTTARSGSRAGPRGGRT